MGLPMSPRDKELTYLPPFITTASYQLWEFRRYLDAEAGRHGYYTSEGEAA